MKLIILDRDGVINYDSPNYIKSPDEWQPLPGSLEAIAKLHDAGYTVSVATNQSGIARGFYTHEILDAIHGKMRELVNQHGGKIDSIFYCPHHPDEGCQCRKPNPGLLEQIAEHYQVPLDDIPFVGDRLTDLLLALSINAQPIFVRSAYAVPTLDERFAEVARFDNLQDYVNHLLANQHERE